PPGLEAMLRDGARTMGWADAPRLSFPAYVAHFISEFITGWMPTLAPRNALNHAVLLLPVMAIFCAIAGFIVSLRRLRCGEEKALDVIVVAGILAIAVALTAHIFFS